VGRLNARTPAPTWTVGAVRISVNRVRALHFDDGSPVTAASGIAPLGDGWLIAQDDATFAAWRRDESVTPVRLLPAEQGLDRFSEASGTKHLKPDLEAACPPRWTASRRSCSSGPVLPVGACTAFSSGWPMGARWRGPRT
jgi:hypothetical protein